MTDWVKHNSSEPPELPWAAMVEWAPEGSVSPAVVSVDLGPWPIGDIKPFYYRQIRDEDGIPYISAEGLEPWAEYITTMEDGRTWQSDEKPFFEDGGWRVRISYAVSKAPQTHRRPGDCKSSLYRVWRD